MIRPAERRTTRPALVGLAALVLATGCEIASAQGPDGGVAVRPRARDAGAAAVADRRPPRDAGAATDGGRRWRPRADGGTVRARRARDAGRAPTAEAMDAGIAEAIPAIDVLDAGAASAASAPEADAGIVRAGGEPPIDAVPTALADAGAGMLDASTLAGDAGPALAADPDASLATDLDAATAAAAADAGAALATEPDAGPALAAPPSAPPSLPPWLDPWELFARERSAREDAEREDDDRREDEPRDRTAPAPIVTVLPGSGGEAWERLEALVPALPADRGGVVVLLGLIALAALAARSIGRARRRLPERGAIPRTLALAHAVLRVGAVLLALGVLAQLLPDWARPALPWVVVATAVALGWSARDLLPDLVAGAVLLAERRLARGEHVAVGDHAGVVLHLGLRVTTLRDGEGRTVQVPNRVVLASPTATRRAGWHEVRVRVRAGTRASGEALARALRDAALLSPYVPIPTRVEVARDPDEEGTYVVRTTLIDARFEERFRGELLGRAETILASSSHAPEGTASS